MRILTFDIEEWFHILDNQSTKTEAEWGAYEKRLDSNVGRIIDILESRNLKATFFCLGWVAREFPEVVRRIVDQGHEIASHSDRHQLAYEQTPEEFRTDLRASIRALEDAGGQRIRAYRAPGFSLKEENKWVFEILIEEGIEVDCSIFPAARAHGGFAAFGEEVPTLVNCASGSIREFPINTAHFMGRPVIFSGGGYFRVLPYWIIRALTEKSEYVMTYFHPRDFDPDQPMIGELSAIRKFKSYYGLAGARKKLEQLLDGFSFVSLGEAEQSVDWAVAPVVKIR